jgi:hypothetical protein
MPTKVKATTEQVLAALNASDLPLSTAMVSKRVRKALGLFPSVDVDALPALRELAAAGQVVTSKRPKHGDRPTDSDAAHRHIVRRSDSQNRWWTTTEGSQRWRRHLDSVAEDTKLAADAVDALDLALRRLGPPPNTQPEYPGMAGTRRPERTGIMVDASGRDRENYPTVVLRMNAHQAAWLAAQLALRAPHNERRGSRLIDALHVTPEEYVAMVAAGIDEISARDVGTFIGGLRARRAHAEAEAMRARLGEDAGTVPDA